MSKIVATYKPLSSLVMRFPHYPLDALLRCLGDEETMMCLFSSNEFKNAILFASPALYSEFKRWLSGEMTNEKDREKVKLSLLKYLIRMSSRCTPFASLASCGCATWGKSHCIQLKDIRVERFRLDMLYSCLISEKMMQDKSIREKVLFRLNSTIYALGNSLRYITYVSHGSGRVFQVREIARTRPLSLLIKCIDDFVPFQSLVSLLQDTFDLNADIATDYLNDLIDNQLLVGNIEPSVTGEDMLSQWVKNIAPFQKQWEAKLEELRDALAHLSSSNPIEDNESQYARIKEVLAGEKIKANPKFLVQLDSFSELSQASIEQRIVDQLNQGIAFLCRVSPIYQMAHIERFKQRFSSRYQEQEIPLLEALDPDVGVGYIHTQDRISNPLINGINVPKNVAPASSQALSSFHHLLLKKLIEQDWKHTGCIQLSEKDVANFPLSFNDLPVSLAAMVELKGQTDNGDYLLGNLRFWGCSGANLLGRFAYGDDKILDLVKQVTEREQEAHDDCIVAEVAHIPQSRTGNILSRPHIRKYEIIYLANSSIDNDYHIPVNDLMVSVRHGRIRLRSLRLKKDIIPRLTTAHNYSGTDTSPVYRFLCDLQHQYGRSSLAFSWGALSNLEHLPRVMYGNIIFSYEQWNLRYEDLPFKKGHVTPHQLNEWVRHYGLPRYVSLVSGDNKLLVDTSCVMSVEVMMSEVHKGHRITIEEFIPCKGIARDHNGDDYMNECVIPLVKTRYERS